MLIGWGGMVQRFCYYPRWVVFATRMRVGPSMKVVCGCSDRTSSLAAGQNMLEQERHRTECDTYMQ